MNSIAKISAGLVVGLVVGYLIGRPRLAPVESAAPSAALSNGGVLVERSPTAPVPPPIRQAATEVRGGKLERVVTVTVQPRPVAATEQARTTGEAFRNGPPPTFEGEKINIAPPTCSCAPVEVQLGLVRMPDQTRRVVATATGGDIVAAIDIPIERATLPRAAPRWSALGMYGPDGYGAGAARRLGPLNVGVLGLKVRGELMGFALVTVPLF